MVSLLLFASIVLLIAAALFFTAGACAICNPFASNRSTFFGLLHLFFTGPLLIVAAFNANNYRENYCPPLEPIAAPAFAAAPIEADDNERRERELFAQFHVINDRLANELSLKTTALTAASETILELQNRIRLQDTTINTLQNRIKALEATRIKAAAPTPTPIKVQTPKQTGCSKPTCGR